jgi:hypothetical protein
MIGRKQCTQTDLVHVLMCTAELTITYLANDALEVKEHNKEIIPHYNILICDFP